LNKLRGFDKAALDKDGEALARHLGYIKQDTIHISNLPYKVDEKDLRDLFGDCGTIKMIKIPMDRSTDMSKGFAFVTFETDKAAKKAINYDGHTFYKRKLKI
jgi:RNA recognition motif-containing protein